jgi:N-acetylglutamate synthase-like GNAT family acetyltransferase
VEPVVRDARLTDIDRITGLMDRADMRWSPEGLNDAADVLRQMTYLPNAALMVCLDGRTIVGACALTLRPSVAAAGLVGAIDLMVIEPGLELDGVVDALLRESVRQARNKGCVVLEGNAPAESAELVRWETAGFTENGPQMRLPLMRSAVAVW